jgi:hypothetical protein
MKHSVMLTITSLLSILFMTFHLTDDIVRGMEPGGVSTLVGLLILAVWLYGTLVLAERRLGYVVILLGSILGAGVPVVHMRGAGLVGGRIANSSGVFFWVWTLIALGVTAIFSVILSARGLCSGSLLSVGQRKREVPEHAARLMTSRPTERSRRGARESTRPGAGQPVGATRDSIGSNSRS